MRYLFLFAHPDDESAAVGGTICQLVDIGHEVIVVLATDGSNGEIAGASARSLAKLGSIAAVRRAELNQACQILGVHQWECLGFKDGRITNQDAWGRLTKVFIKKINHYRPDVVITFDHSGWYYHLDHVAVSVAAITAFRQAQHQPQLMFFALFRPIGLEEKWPYVFSQKLPITHEVDIRLVLQRKIAALKAHASQALDFIPYLKNGQMHKEYFQLARATSIGQELLSRSKVFRLAKEN